MNEEIVDEIYAVLVERFNIGEVFLPKDIGRTENITWKHFITKVIDSNFELEELASYSYFQSVFEFNVYVKSLHPSILLSKNGSWGFYLLSLISKRECTCCYKILNTTNFLVDSSKCTDCTSKYYKTREQEVVLKRKKQYKEKKSSILRRSQEYRQTNKEVLLEKNKDYYKNNKHIFRAKDARYRASKLQATPNWANLTTIREIYRTCPEGYHVDHIIPLQNDLVCGLHCEFNLQHLPASENLSKGNRFEV
jgi:hypothetical protein